MFGDRAARVPFALERRKRNHAQLPAVHEENHRGRGGLWVRGREGFWIGTSLNKRRNPSSNVGRFMTDAATALAVLALTQSSSTEPMTAALRS